MGQAKTRKLNLVAKATAGEDVEIELGDKASKRLAALLFMSQGAELAVQAAQAHQKTMRQKYEEAIGGILESYDVEITEGSKVDHNPDKGLLVISSIPVNDGPTPMTTGPDPDQDEDNASEQTGSV